MPCQARGAHKLITISRVCMCHQIVVMRCKVLLVWEKQTYCHLIHIFQMANQLLIGHMQDSLSWGVWVGGHTWKTTHPQAMEFFGVQKYFLLRVQHNIIEFLKHKRSGSPNEIPFTAIIKVFWWWKGGKGRVSVSTLTYFQNRNRSQKKMPM